MFQNALWFNQVLLVRVRESHDAAVVVVLPDDDDDDHDHDDDDDDGDYDYDDESKYVCLSLCCKNHLLHRALISICAAITRTHLQNIHDHDDDDDDDGGGGGAFEDLWDVGDDLVADTHSTHRSNLSNSSGHLCL